MNFTSTNIENRLLLAKCCFADLAIDYLQKKNIGDKEQYGCLLKKMKQLYCSIEALNCFTPSAELAPSWTYAFTSFTSNFTGTRTLYIDGVQISDEVSFVAATKPQQGVAIAASINLYQTDYVATISSTNITITSILSGTTNNGLELTVSTDGGTPVSGGTLAGGADQWCLDDTKAQKILENIDQLCGCPCDCDDNILTDTIPRYIS